MYQIFDCLGKPVGRPQGYAKHSTAHAIVSRAGKVRDNIWSAYKAKDWGQYQIRHAWSIRLVEGAHTEIETMRAL